jgi:acetyl esterase/lipase
VLDSVRAARDMPDSGASDRFAVWGHSQGGHAALYTGELAARYAPDLKLVGVAAAAPATYLVELFDTTRRPPRETI